MQVSNKNVEISLLKANPLKAQPQGPSTEAVNELRLQNATLLSQSADL